MNLDSFHLLLFCTCYTKSKGRIGYVITEITIKAIFLAKDTILVSLNIGIPFISTLSNSAF